MKPVERVLAALNHQERDRIPRFEIWIDALHLELDVEDPCDAYAAWGQDCVMMPSHSPPDSKAWKTGTDEWGRIWRQGMYHDGAVHNAADLVRYSPPDTYAEQLFQPDQVRRVRKRFPDHCLIYGTHVGPFTAAYMAMGFARFFTRVVDEPRFVHRLLAARTRWCIALYQQAIDLGAQVLVLGDDAAHKDGPMISPSLWRELVLPYHKQIVRALDRPVIWHSDGNIATLLPMAVEAGFVGVHGLEPAAGMSLRQVRAEWGDRLALVGNVDIRALLGHDLARVRREVDRCVTEGGSGSGYMLATCNSIFEGMTPAAVSEYFRYAETATA